jgi:hypothetical protein
VALPLQPIHACLGIDRNNAALKISAMVEFIDSDVSGGSKKPAAQESDSS